MDSSARFTGFPSQAFDFFAELARHNDREWFQAHKDVYEQSCRDPMKRLVADLGADPDKTKLSRINRDLRFSKDKAPYRTYIAAGVDGSYISLSAAGVYVGAGVYKPEGAALARYRDAVANDATGRGLSKIVTSLRRKDYDVDTHERLKSAPRGYPADHPRVDLLRMKGLFAGKTFTPVAWLSTRGALERITRVVIDVKPLAEWLDVHVGCDH